MPQAAADALFGRLIEAFPPDRTYSHEAFEQPPMPPLVAHFLAGWLDLRLTYELDQLPPVTSDWLDQDHNAVQQAREAFKGALRKHGHFPSSEWDPVLRQAVHQVMHHLIRPVSTAVSFIFQEERDTLPTIAIDQRMRLFKAYLYIPETTWLYFKQKEINEISRARLQELLYRIDRHMTKDHDTETWLHLIKPLFTLYRQAMPGAQGLPAPLLKAFFDEKGEERYVERFDQQGAEILDETAVRQLLMAETKPPTKQTAPAASLPPISSERAPAHTPEEIEALPRWKQFQQEQKRTQTSTEPPPQPVRPVPPPNQVATPTPLPGAQPRWMQFRQGAEPPGIEVPEPARLERDVIGEAGLRNRDLFIKQLFAGSVEGYEHVLRRLYAAPTWADASKIIAEEVFRKNQVNIYSQEAVLFTDAVEKRYANRT